MSIRLACIVAGLCLFVSACAPGRMADLRDSGQLAMGIGLGLGVDAKLGFLSHPAIGTTTASALVGVDSRDIHGSYMQAAVHDPHASFWAKHEGASLLGALNSSGWRAAFDAKEYSVAFAAVREPIGKEPPEAIVGEVTGVEVTAEVDEATWLPNLDQLTFHDSTDVQIGGTLLLFTVRAGLNTLELVDFALGFVGLDIAGDDEQR